MTVTHNNTLQFISQEKDLGVIFNSRLSFDSHINDKVSKANKILGLTRSTFTILNEVTLEKLYKAFVRHHLKFSNCILSPSLENNIMIIENAKRRANKLASSVRHLCYPDQLAKLNLPTLNNRKNKCDMILKITSNIYDSTVKKILHI